MNDKDKWIKLFSIFILILFLLLHFHNIIIYIENDNIISAYEENIDFSNLKTEIKVIALYLPQFHVIKENNQFWGNGFTEWTNVKKSKPRFKGHHQPRFPGDKNGYLGYYDLTDIKVIEKQINLAKSHGIYGFGIYFYWFSGKMLLEKPINIFIENTHINFKFLLIWANENWTKRWDGFDKEILIKQEYKPNDPKDFIKDIKKYIKDKRYISIDKRPVIGLYEPSKIPNLKQTILIWREKSRELGIGEIFILICINKNQIKYYENLNLFDAFYEFPPRYSFTNHRILKKGTYIYSELLYKCRDLNETNLNLEKFPFFRGTMIEWDNCPRKNNCAIFDHYSPEQFYLFNKIVIDWTIKHYNKDLRFIFINAWNEWGEGSYLEPDDKYGYASINSLSKAIFNLSYIEKYHSIGNYKIAVLVIIRNEDLIKEIIHKINNIPYIYDLFIIIEDEINIDKLKKFINLNSNKYQLELITLFNNENLLKFLFKLRIKMKNYKYICNINTNQYKNITYYEELKNYQYNNLLGNSKIISEIITDFERNNKLGIIFPETYYKSLIKFGEYINDNDLEYVNFFLNKIYPRVNISQSFADFPEGNMFWAKTDAIYPIFNLFSKVILNKKFLLLLSIYLEKIWVYIVNINGFLYKKIFKHL